ncbi:MAG TPA: BamA/TamA family outer membrane protein [Gemmatimonadaceae bacterium]|nr:BamA/TamA family outer membrane protein [Gemmatimonadaceae bacterium]
MSARRRTAAFASTGLLIAAMTAPTGAQQVVSPADSIARDSAATRCMDERVTSIEYRRDPPPLMGGRTPSWIRPVLRVLVQHSQTGPEAIRPFLLVREGESCTTFKLQESERLLRAQPYLANAELRAYPDRAGGVQVVVHTVDEIPLVIDGGVRSGELSKLTYGNGNVLGRGIYAAARWRQGFAYRDAIGVELAHYHLPGRGRARLDVMRGSFGEAYSGSLTNAYLTDAQRAAWHLGYHRSEDFIEFLRQDAASLSLGLDRDLVDAGVLWRVGQRGRRLFAGATAAHEAVTPAARGISITDTGFVADPDTVLVDRFDSWSTTSVGAVLGGRFLTYRTMEGLSSLAGTHDVATGVQVAATLGRGISGSRRRQFSALDLYAAAGTQRTLFALGGITEGRRAPDGGWEDVIASGRLVVYRAPSERRANEVSVEYSGAWGASLPGQIALDERRGGVRGYRDSRVGGTRRAVFRIEERRSLGRMGRLAGFAIAGFADAGKVWAGDAPFGTTTGVRTSVGAGLLVAVPRQSQRLFRFDAAVPLVRGGTTRSWTARLFTTTAYPTFWREPRDVALLRAPRPASELLVWP